ncbi:hypothetical protein [Sphingobacterium hungaricum]|uniref:hypothetical protein n=1 Tax=Sphingobacterium hungaricum TaxID=2082723 RepID=UPI0018CAEEF3|nr:hypothetical protein [Sphingobacterium hungaricum]
MKLFNFLKRTQKTDPSPEKSLRRLIDYMPDFYQSYQQFVDSVDFLEHKEWELALDSLVELADETGHYFAEEFWIALANSADKMNLKHKSNYCRKQIERNLEDLKAKTPFGWTTIKFDENHFQHHISEKLKEEWATERHKKDKTNDLLTIEGVHLKSHGRSGFLYITEEGKIAEVEFELGVNGLILYFNSLENWSLPKKRKLTTDEKNKLKNRIVDWATKTKNAIEFDDY